MLPELFEKIENTKSACFNFKDFSRRKFESVNEFVNERKRDDDDVLGITKTFQDGTSSKSNFLSKL
jgi:hypothetical protein